MRLLALILCTLPALATESDALALSALIQARHLPFGTLLDPFYASATSSTITGYTRCGDSALWTGHYLAAEALRFRVTRSPEALANATRALNGLQGLVDVTGNDSLARCRIALDSPFRAGIEREEAANGVFINAAQGHSWIGNLSRDQYLGVYFGLSLAFEHLPSLRPQTRSLVTRLTNYLIAKNWSEPIFALRPDQQLAILQIARQINPDAFTAAYVADRNRLADSVSLPVAFDSLSTSSYFKFNLIYMSFYSLIRLEDTPTRSTYLRAYSIARNYTAAHQNPYFNLIDHALTAPDARRDSEALALLDLWLKRPTRDFFVDRRSAVRVCGDQACEPIPVDLRTPTDFLWQRSPFQLAGGGAGTIGNAGVDYLLPYWLARYYGLLPSLGVQPAVAPNAIVSLYGPVPDQPRVEIDGRPATVFFASSNQINLLVPPETPPGPVTFKVLSDGPVLTAQTVVQPVAPSLYTLNAQGLAAATATSGPVFACTPQCVATPIALPAIVSLYATGLRQATETQVSIGGLPARVLYSGPQPSFPGLDQVNVEIPAALAGRGPVEIRLTADGMSANPVSVTIR